MTNNSKEGGSRLSAIFFFDTTLRDGAQGEGVFFSIEDKLRIAKKLDELGIDYIEGGWPGSNPKDIEFFQKIKNHRFKQAKITAFGSTRRADNALEKDPVLQNLFATGTEAVAIFRKSWDLHVREVLRISLEKNLEIIADSISFLKSHGKEVIYDAEHFFDGYKNNPGYAMETLKAAVQGGADWLVLCDTNGGTFPMEIKEITQKVSDTFDIPVGIHCHNDTGMAVANSVMAVKGGAVQVQGTINGYGERCGNADLCSIIPNLQLKLGYKCVEPEKLAELTGVSRYVSEIANLAHNERMPYVGNSAF